MFKVWIRYYNNGEVACAGRRAVGVMLEQTGCVQPLVIMVIKVYGTLFYIGKFCCWKQCNTWMVIGQTADTVCAQALCLNI